MSEPDNWYQQAKNTKTQIHLCLQTQSGEHKHTNAQKYIYTYTQKHKKTNTQTQKDQLAGDVQARQLMSTWDIFLSDNCSGFKVIHRIWSRAVLWKETAESSPI